MKLGNTSTHQSAGRILALIAFAFAWPVDANAQWTAASLHPNGASRSWAIDIGDGQQAGYAVVGGLIHACLWYGSANSFEDLHPTGADESQAREVDGGQQVGSAYVGGVSHASLWSSAAASQVDLTPYWAGATESVGSGVGGGEQVGSVTVGGVRLASVWTGTAGSWMNLHPLGATSSGIGGTDGVQQVGNATVGGSWRASLWYGIAASWVDLTPAGAVFASASAVDDGQQVGSAWFEIPGGNARSRASLWNNTAASWVNLSPPGMSNWASSANAVHGGQQVGQVGLWAALWNGTPESYVDLHAFLPRKFGGVSGYSVALGIWQDATHTYVVGAAHNIKKDRMEALMWRRPNESPPPPGGVTVTDISPNAMDVGTMINVTITGSGFQPSATVIFENGKGSSPSVSNVVVVNASTLDATLSVGGGGPPGTRVWDLRVNNPDSSTGVLVDGFAVIK